jgi:predicted tellurium resistance membrane protein TerC
MSIISILVWIGLTLWIFHTNENEIVKTIVLYVGTCMWMLVNVLLFLNNIIKHYVEKQKTELEGKLLQIKNRIKS